MEKLLHWIHSIRTPMHVTDAAVAAVAGAHIATVPLKIIKQMIKHPLTDAGIDKFANDWKETFGN